MKYPVLLAAALLSACATSPPPRTPEAALNDLVEEYFERQLELSPMAATAIGDTRYDDRLDETTSAGFRERQLAVDQAFLERARRIDPAGLPPTARITYDIFVSERELALEGRIYPEELMPLNQMSGLPMDLAVYGSGTGPQPFVTAKDYDRFLARLRQFPRWADGAIDMMRAGMARGVTLPRPAMAKVVPQLRGIVTANLTDNIFWAPVAAMPKEISAKDRERIRAAYAAALTNEVVPAYTRLADFIERRLSTGRANHGWLGGSARRPGLVSLAHSRRHHHGHAGRRNTPSRPGGSRAHPGRNAHGEEPGRLQGRSRRVLQIPGGRPAVLLHERG